MDNVKANHQVPTPPGSNSWGQGAWCGTTSPIQYIRKWLCRLSRQRLRHPQPPQSGSRESTGQSIPSPRQGTAGQAPSPPLHRDSKSCLEKPKLGGRVMGHPGQAGHSPPPYTHLRAAGAAPAQGPRGAGLRCARQPPAAGIKPAGLAGLCKVLAAHHGARQPHTDTAQTLGREGKVTDTLPGLG